MLARPLSIQLLSRSSISASILFVSLVVHDWGGSASAVGFVVAGYNLAYLVSNMLGGRASDIYPRRWIVRVGLLLSVLAFLSQALVTYYTESIFLFALARICGGLAAGLFYNALVAFVYEGTGKVGLFTSMGSLGWAIGMLAAGTLGLFHYVYLFATALFAICFIISMGLEPLGEKKMRIPLFPKELIKKNIDAYGALLIRHTGAAMVWVTFPIFLGDIGASRFWIGIIYAVNMVTQFICMPFLDRFESKKLIIGGLVFSFLSFSLFTTARIWWHMLPFQVVLGMGWAMLFVGSLKHVLKRSEEKATASGVLVSTISLSGLIGPLIGGNIAEHYGYKPVMFLAAGFAMAALVWFIFKESHLQKAKALS